MNADEPIITDLGGRVYDETVVILDDLGIPTGEVRWETNVLPPLPLQLRSSGWELKTLNDVGVTARYDPADGMEAHRAKLAEAVVRPAVERLQAEGVLPLTPFEIVMEGRRPEQGAPNCRCSFVPLDPEVEMSEWTKAVCESMGVPLRLFKGE